jgi:hypothetical protein
LMQPLDRPLALMGSDERVPKRRRFEIWALRRVVLAPGSTGFTITSLLPLQSQLAVLRDLCGNDRWRMIHAISLASREHRPHNARSPVGERYQGEPRHRRRAR